MAQHFFRHLTEDAVNIIEFHLPLTLDASEFDLLNESVLSVVDGQTGSAWVIDMSNTAYLGSSVLGLMVNIRQRVKQANGRLVLCGLSPRLFQIFRTSCLERLFDITRTREDAVYRVR
jgi:anti-anti-sigma factor